MPSVKIIIATHKKYRMPDDEMYIPVQVGAEGKDDLGYTRDNTGCLLYTSEAADEL